jgi:hypothetical protein
MAADPHLDGRRPVNQTEDPSQSHLVFFDNLRSLMVLLVLVFHAGASYGAFPPFWPFREAETNELITHIMPLLEVFMMSILFFVAGYFALPSLQRRGGKRFLASKFKRLGIPWLVVTVLVLPVLDYVHYYTRCTGDGLAPRRFGSHWWQSMKRIGEFHVGRMRMSGYLDMTEHFYQRYMWFLSLLLLFFVLFWLLYQARGKWVQSRKRPLRKVTRAGVPVYAALAATAALNVVFFILVKALTSSLDDPFDLVWFSLGNIVQFELAKLAFYVPYFGLGVYAYARGWFGGEARLGQPRVWGAVCFLLTAATMLAGRSMTRAAVPSLGLQLALAVLYPLWTFSFLGVFVVSAARYWNRATSLTRRLAVNSYNMYLAHYAVVMTLPLVLSAWTGGASLVKFGIVAVVTIVASYVASECVIRPRPRLAVLGLGVLSLALAAFA